MAIQLRIGLRCFRCSNMPAPQTAVSSRSERIPPKEKANRLDVHIHTKIRSKYPAHALRGWLSVRTIFGFCYVNTHRRTLDILIRRQTSPMRNPEEYINETIAFCFRRKCIKGIGFYFLKEHKGNKYQTYA